MLVCLYILASCNICRLLVVQPVFALLFLCVFFEEDHSNQKTRTDADKDKELEALRTKV